MMEFSGTLVISCLIICLGEIFLKDSELLAKEVVAETRYNMINTSDIKNNTIRFVISATKKEIKNNLVKKKS